MEEESLHGKVGVGGNLPFFGRLLPVDAAQPGLATLQALAVQMQDMPDTPNDDPDPEENLLVPAGYTYFGQFIDHDLTFDTTSTLDFTDKTPPTNARTPRFDLDNLYGPGPSAAPYMYQRDGVRLIEGKDDLPRSAESLRAIIGDPRNDENSIVCQLQMAFIKFHNAVAKRIADNDHSLTGTPLFNKVRKEVQWTYQHILVHDFLPRIIGPKVIAAFDTARDPDGRGLSRKPDAYLLFTKEDRTQIPMEFSAACYRFGHSMVRTGYRLNEKTQLSIFHPPRNPTALGPGSPSAEDSLVGFQPLPESHLIHEWSRFFPNPERDGAVSKAGTHASANDKAGNRRLQFAYKIDTTLEEPLAHLPQAVVGSGETEYRLAARNLERGAKFQLASGQALAERLDIPPLDPKYLVVRTKKNNAQKVAIEQFVPIALELQKKTPLWFYILAEAQVPVVDWAASLGTPTFTETQLLDNAAVTVTQLGHAGGRLVLEVFNGLLDSDPDTYRNAAPVGWVPMLKHASMWDLVNLNFK